MAPVRSKVTPSGCAAMPRSITFVTALVAGSITVTVWPGGFVSPARPERLFATYSRSPCGVVPYAMPAGKLGTGIVPTSRRADPTE